MTFPFSKDRPLWLLGCGNMAGAMLGRWLECGLDPAAVVVIKPSAERVPAGVRHWTMVPGGATPPAALLIGVKPQKFAEVCADATVFAGPETVVVSIMAGIDSAALGEAFAAAAGIVRIMPNLPVALGKGVSTVHVSRGGADTVTLADALTAPLGLTVTLDSENLFDAATAVTGSGPAFVYRFIEAMAAGAERMGFSPEQAAAMALATIDGASALANRADVPPASLADRVASPGGMTRAGLDVLDGDRALLDLVEKTLRATADRGAELAKLAG
jgi:pyrroline-5-carboxylate reductase